MPTLRPLCGVSKAEYQVFPAVRSHPSCVAPYPRYAVYSVELVTVSFVFLGDNGVVTGRANPMLLFVLVHVNAALLWLRYSRPDADRWFRARSTSAERQSPLSCALTCLGRSDSTPSRRSSSGRMPASGRTPARCPILSATGSGVRDPPAPLGALVGTEWK